MVQLHLMLVDEGVPSAWVVDDLNMHINGSKQIEQLELFVTVLPDN